ncbi:ATP-binding protein [Pseudogemmatithrix spongiicola]|uniref:ATP-binding protein n=1 Tax=Pseudogemmatithrix spongiicola TaxID=3062599 RepID=A0AA49JSY0_9BACT|nr:ATP-binding protein [Gemmatimonadaceae bacterium 'strain 138']WKW14271.1 ATP-binding protein [Gemmatimonadaceae bacterium 'strain 318']
MKASDIKVTSHVGRDLLAAAASFKHEAAVVWEYVVNSLQYVERGLTPSVQVEIAPRARRILISDNGRGMTASDLQHYFQMHGENRDRAAGRPGRGKFGTGKSAAFGIGTSLTVDTRRNGLRNVVHLSRAAIDASNGSDIPIEWRVRNESTTGANGTVVTIDDIVLPRIEASRVIEYIERHLSAFRGLSPEVAVNDHVCSAREPVVSRELKFEPSPAQRTLLGDVVLVVRVARSLLGELDQGVQVTCGPGNLVAIEKGGVDRKEYGAFLFGNVDVPALERHESPIQPFDASRSLSLNPLHPVSAALIAFIGASLEKARLELVSDAREHRKTEQARKLAEAADKIAEVLNKDFAQVQGRLFHIRSASGSGPAHGRSARSELGGDDQSSWIEGASEPGELASEPPQRTDNPRGRKAPDLPRLGDLSDSGSRSVDPAGGTGNRKRATGGFQVRFEELGKEEPRSVYDSSSLTIFINLLHPAVEAALGDGDTENVLFRRLAYEVAFSEYAIALGHETVKADPDLPANDLLYEIRASLNRVSASAASLYRT